MMTFSGPLLASVLCLTIPAAVSAQLRGFELAAGGEYLGWSSMLPSSSNDGTDERITLRSQWGAGASLAVGFGSVVALRANALYARSALIRSDDRFFEKRPAEAFIDRDVRVLSASGDLIIRPLGSRSRRLLFLMPVVPYLALGAGVTWMDPIPGEDCEDDAGSLCGTSFIANGETYLLERRTTPTGLVALGLHIPLHRYLGLSAEIGDRLMRSPISRLSRDGNGTLVRGDRVDQIVHGTYGRVGVQLFPTSQRKAPSPRPTPAAVSPVTPLSSTGVADTTTRQIVAVEPPPPAADATVPQPAIAAQPVREPQKQQTDSILTLLDVGASVDTLTPEAVWVTSAGSVAPAVAAATNGSTAPNGSDGQYDVVLDVPNVSVDDITLEVNNLHAHVSLDAKVAKLVSLNVGADVGIDRVFLGIRGVQAEAYLKVDLDNVTKIVDRVLTTIDRNPEIISGLLETLETTVQTVGTVANTALQPGGVVSQVVETVGDVANTALQPGGVVSQAVQTVGEVANTALQPGGVVSQVVETVGDVANTTLQPGGVASQLVGAVGETLGNLTTQGGLLSAEGVNALGQTLTRAVDGTGRILERTLDQTGALVGERVLGNVLQLPILGQGSTPTGQILRTVQDASGALIEVTLDAAGRILGTRVLEAASGAARAAAIPTLQPQPAAAIAQPQPAAAVEPQTHQASAAAQQGTTLLLVAVGVRPDGNIVQRVIDPAGTLLERVVDPISGNVLSRTPIGNIMRLALVNQRVDSLGNIVRVVQDASGAIIELTMNATGILSRMRALKLGSVTQSVASAVAPQSPSAYPVAPNPSAGSIVAATPTEEEAEAATGLPADSVPTLLLGQYQNERGRLVQRFVDMGGNITERYLNAAGQLVVKKRVANARRFPPIREYSTAAGEFVRVVRDDLGALLELTFSREGKLGQVRLLARGVPAAAPLGAPTASASSVPPVTPVSPVTPVAPLSSAPIASLTPPAASDIAAVLTQRTNAAGQIVQRLIDVGGKIVERTVDAAGRTIAQREVGSLLQLRVMSQIPQGDGRLLLIARDVTGVLVEVLLGPDRRVLSVKKMG